MVRRNETARVMPGFWVFPGGTLEPEDGEGEAAFRACALRELQEETGIVDVEIDPGFRERIRYEKIFRKAQVPSGVWKEVVYFLGRAKDEGHALSDEHDRSGWFSLAQALDRLSHENLRGVLRAAARRAGAF